MRVKVWQYIKPWVGISLLALFNSKSILINRPELNKIKFGWPNTQQPESKKKKNQNLGQPNPITPQHLTQFPPHLWNPKPHPSINHTSPTHSILITNH